MPTRDELPPRTGPWASRFDSEEVYGTDMVVCAAQATAIGIDQVNPYGPAVDPTTVPLAELGLDVPGVDRRFVNFCAGVLGVEAVDDLGMLRASFDAAWPDYRETVRAGLLHMAEHRPMTVRQWHQPAYVLFPDEQALTVYLAHVYAYLFGDYPAMPVAPN